MTCEYELDRLEQAIKGFVDLAVTDERWLHECVFHNSESACDWSLSAKWVEKKVTAEKTLKEAFTDLNRCLEKLR